MAVSNFSGLQINNPEVGIQITKVTDTSADWPSVANSTYFYDKGDGLVHYKNSSGVVLELFSAGGGLTYFTEAQSTASPNATVNVDSLTPVTATTNADFAIVPKGNGAILAQVPDNTVTGGNKRGQYAVDLQRDRSVVATSVASGNYSCIPGGKGNKAAGDASFSVGLNNSSNSTADVTIGNLNTATGGGYPSVAIGESNSSSTGYAYSFGVLNAASGSQSMAVGHSNTTSSQPSFSFGMSNISNAVGALTLGRLNTANGNYSTVIGYQGHSFGIYGRQVYASGQEGTAGDAQASKFILKNRTTNDTATTITTDSGAAGAANQVILSNQSAYRFKGSIVGKQSGSVNAAVWDIDGFIVRGANAAATTLNVSNVNLVQNTPAWGTPTLAADTTNGGLQVQVIGAAATNIQWTAVIETTEVIYA
jgi:hypothetical protein